jgi:hypothetical protein
MALGETSHLASDLRESWQIYIFRVYLLHTVSIVKGKKYK